MDKADEKVLSVTNWRFNHMKHIISITKCPGCKSNRFTKVGCRSLRCKECGKVYKVDPATRSIIV